MIYKYTLSVTGNEFYPSIVLGEIQGDFLTVNQFNPNDKPSSSNSIAYGYGCVSFWHPNHASTEDEILNYENSLVEFLIKNYNLFIRHGVQTIEIFMEIFFDGRQCNFEVFSNTLLKKLSNFGVSLPISIYVLEEEKIQQWEEEIRHVWKNTQ
ncbi:MAG: hypothetical protein RLZZ262_794 [Bacteroidota bacterium]|jgi:hypothetical protein